jgi:plasmid replication initiation protein
MRQLYDKSGSAARFSDFAIDVRKIVEADTLPEYALRLHRNGEGEDVVAMIRRNLLSPSDPRFEMQRTKQRRKGSGLQQKALTFSE